MIQFTVDIYLEPYLAQWYIHENGGQHPIVPKKLSIESRVLETFLRTRPNRPAADNPKPNLVKVELVIPHFRCKDPQYYNYLPKPAKGELKRDIRNRFVWDLWKSLNQFRYIGMRRDNLVIAWMEAHGIEFDDTNYNTILKIYQRQYKTQLENERREDGSKPSNKKQ